MAQHAVLLSAFPGRGVDLRAIPVVEHGEARRRCQDRGATASRPVDRPAVPEW